jgi:hypothetical protein
MDCIFENINEFQINNFIIDKFKAYIYDDKGEYFIGGKDVSVFIINAIKLIKL